MRPQQAFYNFLSPPRESCCLGFCRELVLSFPGIFNFHGRSHPALVAAATGKTLELSRAAGGRGGRGSAPSLAQLGRSRLYFVEHQTVIAIVNGHFPRLVFPP
jgi:hypothetical protein